MKFYGTIGFWWQGADDYTRTINEIEAKGIKNLIIRTHCYGGEVFEGSAMWSANMQSKLNITFKIDGMAASMMGILIMSGNDVQISSIGKVMFHAPRSGAGGTSKDHANEAALLKKMENDFINVMVSKTKMTKEDAAKYMDGFDYWLDAEECVKLGIASKIIPETAFTTDVKGKPDNKTPIDKIFAQYKAQASGEDAPIPVAPIPSQQSSQQNKRQQMDKLTLITAFSLAGVNAESSDSAVLAALQAKYKAQEDALNQAKEANKEITKAQATVAISTKETELKAKFTDDQRKEFMAVAETCGIATLSMVLSSMKPALNIANLIEGERKDGNPFASAASSAQTTSLISEDRKAWTLKDWQEKDAAGLEKLSNSTDAVEAAYFKKIYLAEYPDAAADFK